MRLCRAGADETTQHPSGRGGRHGAAVASSEPTQGTQITVRNARPQVRATLHAIGWDRLQRHHDE
ncbi:hypothetical protein GCM10022295_82220 [Streptomyces osmaniensis]|uniref:Uncharacterized protein n=1 Tax=Streptomyces osmaniensis TaxID=593134 RepID=A0ABP6YPV6_9ACTN